MNPLTRCIAALICVSACVIGAVVCGFSTETPGRSSANLLFNAPESDEYQNVRTAQRQFSFAELESVIRRDRTVAGYRGRIEFGSVKLDGDTASVHVLFVPPSGRTIPYLYTLRAADEAWKIQTVQRLWFIPAAQLRRGLRV